MHCFIFIIVLYAHNTIWYTLILVVMHNIANFCYHILQPLIECFDCPIFVWVVWSTCLMMNHKFFYQCMEFFELMKRVTWLLMITLGHLNIHNTFYKRKHTIVFTKHSLANTASTHCVRYSFNYDIACACAS